MTKHLLTLALSTGLAIFCSMAGVLFDILIFTKLMKTGEVSSGIGSALGLIAFVTLWYGYIRKGRPVWQPGRRFWIRWAWISGVGFPVVTLDSVFFPFVLALYLANIAYFALDAVKSGGDYRIAPDTRQLR